jgi:hypothetical protein
LGSAEHRLDPDDGRGKTQRVSAFLLEGPMPEAGEGGVGNRNVNIVAIIAIVVLVLLAVFALASRKPSSQVRKETTTESSTPGDVDIKVDVPDSVTIETH